MSIWLQRWSFANQCRTYGVRSWIMPGMRGMLGTYPSRSKTPPPIFYQFNTQSARIRRVYLPNFVSLDQWVRHGKLSTNFGRKNERNNTKKQSKNIIVAPFYSRATVMKPRKRPFSDDGPWFRVVRATVVCRWTWARVEGIGQYQFQVSELRWGKVEGFP